MDSASSCNGSMNDSYSPTRDAYAYCSGKEAAGYTDMAAVGRSLFSSMSQPRTTQAPYTISSGQDLHASGRVAVMSKQSSIHQTSQTSLVAPGALPESEQYVFMNCPTDKHHYSMIDLKEQESQSKCDKPDRKEVSFCSSNKSLWLCVLLALMFAAAAATVSVVAISFKFSSDDSDVHHQLDTTMAQVKQLQQELITISERLNGTEKPSPNITTTTGAVLNLSCTTEKITACHISASESNAPFSLCETTPAQLDKTGYIITDVYCARSDSNGEINPTVTTLHDPGTGTVSCLCYVVIPDPGVPQEADVECGLFVTRCHAPQ